MSVRSDYFHKIAQISLILLILNERRAIVKAGDKVQFMTKFGMPGSVTQEMIDAGKTVGSMQNTFNSDKADFHIYFNAYAIQAEGFTSVSDAFNKAFGEGYKID